MVQERAQGLLELQLVLPWLAWTVLQQRALAGADVRKKEKELFKGRSAYFRNHADYKSLLFNIVRLDSVRILKDFA